MEFPPQFSTLGMFIIDEFSFADEEGHPIGKTIPSQESQLICPSIGGGGTYAAIGARIWLPADKLGMIIDRGQDFPSEIQSKLLSYGTDMWHFRDHSNRGTTRALNSYRGDHRGFEYLTPRIRLTPRDLEATRFARSTTLHFICSPTRALEIISEVKEIVGWKPINIFEPIPDRCVPEELPSLIRALPAVFILSPNAEEALGLLSLPLPVTRAAVEGAAAQFLALGVGEGGKGCVIIRSGALGAYVKTREREGQWIHAFWTDLSKVLDVTGAGNSFIGGLAAGLLLAQNDVYQAAYYASVSASFTIEQGGLPIMTGMAKDGSEIWNGDSPRRRLEELKQRHK
ncbi:Ribokinase-like protein [Hygrophoropsis aurantiaca]|uniref:Ribokinase-like protein n=1 Tax=Hygrophoropsis aurantiaca TaxID=72124 RepID=A0ACB8AUT4_9AGAM|nr:Ribokinase-like protein [Hygrophoropsis aurantiaca]